MASVNDIRTAFLSFFAERDHKIIESSALVPYNDPTLMFTNSGMVQFKNIFTGLEKASHKKAVTAQKCVRAGGKHNDLENVGYTARHHTFFEMLGNFSFGDYFKEQAIEQAWTLVTSEFGLKRDKLFVTVFHEDEEAISLWRSIAGLPEDRIIKISTSDNFWSMGPTGPCGPCSEIFYDHGDHIAGDLPGTPDEDGDRFTEIWNLVFMQYEQMPTERVSLPHPSIDTGMGLERIAAVLQGKHDNYDIDLMRILIQSSADISDTDADGEHNISHRVVADHLRSSSFLIADGVFPSNEGRGYVLRRIMRRAMRHLHQIGCQDPVMHKLVSVLIREMGSHYPELVRSESLITQTLLQEESRFKEALARGLKLLMAEIDNKPSGHILDGKTAFKLYDTYGFPLDLTEDVMRGYGWKVDVSGFESEMLAQKQRARKAWVGSGSQADNPVLLDLADRYGATEFLGYTQLTAQAVITSLLQEGQIVDHVTDKAPFSFTANQTVFYAESGGQIGDSGMFRFEGGHGRITHTTKTAGVIIHHAELDHGHFTSNVPITLDVDEERRKSLSAHHSATHLLHEALRQILGEHVMQKGSLVTDERLRFDFSHLLALNAEEIHSVETMVNTRIRMNNVVSTQIMSHDAAIHQGALALFGEKYGDEVRVVSMGGSAKTQDRVAWSVELCGGTHVQQTGDIALFKIINETAIASGIRRIEAVCHQSALDWLTQKAHIADEMAQLLKTSSDEILERVKGMLGEKRQMEKDISALRMQLATEPTDAQNIEKIGRITFIGKTLSNIPPSDLKPMADQLRKQAKHRIICLATTCEDKASIVVAISHDLTHDFDAVTLVRKAAEIVGGKGGGGRVEMAQAGGPKGHATSKAIDTLRSIITNSETSAL